MDQLLAKFTNFGYEVWGIIVPGLIFLLFMTFAWWCSGSVISFLTFGYVSTAGVEGVSSFLSLLNEEIKAGLFAGLAVSAYFSGHLLHWISRSPKNPIGELGSLGRVWSCMKFSIPKSKDSYDKYLEEQLSEAKQFLGMPVDAKWVQYYPVAKVYLSEKMQSSLVSTYQNKYTLHRSITAAAAVWFWVSVFVIVVSVVGLAVCHPFGSPKWFPLLISPLVAVGVVYGFSDSYQYNWKLFGNYLITEVYAYKRVIGCGRGTT